MCKQIYEKILLPGSVVVKVPIIKPYVLPATWKNTETIAHVKKQTKQKANGACLPDDRPSLDQSYKHIYDNLYGKFTDCSLTLQRSKGSF